MKTQTYFKCILTLLMCVFIASFQTAQNPLTYTAKEGDGIIKLMHQYELDKNKCELNAFLDYNQLELTDYLLAGKEYQLPIQVFDYNGKSIRSTIGINNWDLAVEIKKYNLLLQEKGIKPKLYKTDHILYVPLRFLKCKQEGKAVLTGTKTLHMPILGEKYADINIEDASLKDDVFYLVAGHGGPDPGAMADCQDNVLCEDEYSYDVVLRLARKLLSKGATVEIIIEDPNDGIRDEAFLECDKDELCNNEALPLNQLKRLQQRADLVNQKYINLRKKYKKHTAVMIHVDSRSVSKEQDVYFYHLDDSKSGKGLAQNLYQVFQNKYKKHRASGEYHGSVQSRNLYMLRSTYPPAVFIELGNLKNPDNQKRFILNSNREALAKWIFEGLTK